MNACRLCGCTDDNPCIADGDACGWAEGDLCTFCAAPEMAMDEPRVEIYSEGDLNYLIAQRRRAAA